MRLRGWWSSCLRSRFLRRMLCFTFRNLEKILGWPPRGIFAFLLVFLRGVLERVGVWTWFFDGEDVVECVVKRDGKTVFAWGLKTCHFFRLYFCGIPKMGRSRTHKSRFLHCAAHKGVSCLGRNDVSCEGG